MKKITFALLSCCLFASCASQVKIPPDATADEIVQLGQEAMDKEKYRRAVLYYEAIKDRFPDDIVQVCGADYEIAFIYYKQKKYSEANEAFAALLSKYYGAASRAALPQKYQILSKKVLEKIAVRQKKGKKTDAELSEIEMNPGAENGDGT